MRLTEKRIVLGVTASISAYQSADLISRFVKEGAEVHVVMTLDATRFISPLVLQTLSRHPVLSDMFDPQAAWKPAHIHLADHCDLFCIAPATAHILAKLAAGLADDLVSAIALSTRAPLLVAPAMNGKMYEHPATQRNVKWLRSHGAHFVEPVEGKLACGYEGIGHIAPVDTILDAVIRILRSPSR